MSVCASVSFSWVNRHPDLNFGMDVKWKDTVNSPIEVKCLGHEVKNIDWDVPLTEMLDCGSVKEATLEYDW